MDSPVRDAARLIAAALACTLSLACLATDNGAALADRGGGEGKVVFDGRVHAGKGYSCHDCHTLFTPTGTALFATQKRAFIDMAAHKGRTQCFACHDGKTASKECESCHRENAR